MPSIFEKIQAKLELFRLEQRYTRNRHRRSTFISNAVYKDGEYIYQTPNTTGSSTNSNNSSTSTAPSPWSPNAPATVGIEEEPNEDSYNQDYRRDNARRSFEERTPEPRVRSDRKKMNRWSSMPGFGSNSSASKRNSVSPHDWRSNTVDVNEAR